MASAPIGVAWVGFDGRYLSVNQAMGDMLGYTAEEMRATTWVAVSHPDDRERAAEKLASIVSSGTREYRTDRRYRHTDGSEVWANVNVIVVDNEEGQPVHFLEFAVDISERVRGEQLLKESEERFRVLAEAAAEGVCISEGGRVVGTNAAMAAMHGYEQHELIGIPLETFLAPEFRAEVVAAIAAGRDVRAEFVHVRKDGTRFPTVVTGRSTTYRGHPVRVSAVTDLTDHKRIAALEERRRIARDLHDGLAHELAFVSSQTKSLRREMPGYAVLDQLVTAAERALDEARRAISVLSSAQREQLSVALTRTVEDLAARHDLELQLEVDPALDVADDVGENLLRIVREAITNAGHHGGASKVIVRAWRDQALHLVVEDNGCGFEPAHVSGGFGLVSMEERARAQGANFELRSTPGRGTTIEIVVE